MAAQIHPCDRHVTRLNNPNFPAFTCWVGCPSSTLSFSFSSNLWVTTSFGMSSLCSQHFWMPWPMAKPHQSRKTRPTFATCGLDAKHGDEETTATTSSWPTAHQSSVIGWIGSPALTGSSGKQRRHTSPKSREVTMQLMQSNTLRRTWNKTQTSQLLNSTRIQLGNLFTSVSLLSLRSLFFKPRTMRVGNFTSCLSSSAAASEIRKMHLSPPTKSSQKCRVATYGTCCISGTKYGPVRKDGNQVHWQKCGNQDSTPLLEPVKIYFFLPSGDSHSGSCCFRTKHWHEWCMWWLHVSLLVSPPSARMTKRCDSDESWRSETIRVNTSSFNVMLPSSGRWRVMGDLVIKTISIVVIVNGWGSMGNDDKVSCCN